MARKRTELPTLMAVLCVFLALPSTLCSQAGVSTSAARFSSLNMSPPATEVSGDASFISTEPDTSSIKEFIPAKYKNRYLKWKNDYLSTSAGRAEWDRYAHNPNVTLTITLSKRSGQGALLNGFRWDSEGRLIAATMTLGNKLDSGYPSVINYPITSSLASVDLPSEIRGTILAGTKLAHEFGHLNYTMNMGRLYEEQNCLMLEYNDIFDKNGHNTRDTRLMNLTESMKGNPVSISQERESWAEMGAMLYLQERLKNHPKIKMPQPIRQAIQTYFVTYPGRESLDFAAPK